MYSFLNNNLQMKLRLFITAFNLQNINIDINTYLAVYLLNYIYFHNYIHIRYELFLNYVHIC